MIAAAYAVKFYSRISAVCTIEGFSDLVYGGNTSEPVTLLILAFPDMNQIKHLRPPKR
jgi:hypothetical protein